MDLKQLTKIKDQGNDIFKNKKFQQAIAKFTKCITSIESLQNRDFLSKDTQIGKLYVVCLINAALACINVKQLQQYDNAIKCCDKALSVDTENIKGLYRRGLARKQKAEIIERTQGIKANGLLQLYNKAKEDFQKLCLVDKSNDLATKTLKLIINNIYRVTVGRGEDVFKQQTTKNVAKIQEKIQQEITSQKPKRKGNDMNKIMKQYKVQEVTNIVQQKLRSQYLTADLPSLRSQLQKAIRLLQKSQQPYIQFVYRIKQQYLTKINPTFDILSDLVNILLKKGNGEQAKSVFLAIQKQKGWKLLWKSYSTKEKQALKIKLKQLGLSQQILIN